MIFLKIVRFYKSEIGFIFIFVEKKFCRGCKSQKNLFNKIEEGYLFCKKLDDLQEKQQLLIQIAKMPSTIQHIWGTESQKQILQKFLWPTISSLLVIIALTFFLWCIHSTTKISQNMKYKTRKFIENEIVKKKFNIGRNLILWMNILGSFEINFIHIIKNLSKKKTIMLTINLKDIHFCHAQLIFILKS